MASRGETLGHQRGGVCLEGDQEQWPWESDVETEMGRMCGWSRGNVVYEIPKSRKRLVRKWRSPTWWIPRTGGRKLGGVRGEGPDPEGSGRHKVVFSREVAQQVWPNFRKACRLAWQADWSGKSEKQKSVSKGFATLLPSCGPWQGYGWEKRRCARTRVGRDGA